MTDLSVAARRYIVGMVLLGAVVSAWEIARLPDQSIWPWMALALQAIVTFFLKRRDTMTPFRRPISLALASVGLGLFVSQVPNLPEQNLWLWLGIAALAATSHILKQEGPTARSSYQISKLVYGFSFVFLGTPETVLIIVVAHLLEYTWGEYYPWYIQSFNVATYTVAASGAGLIYRAMDPGAQYQLAGIASIVLQLATFTLINHLLVGLVLKLARGQSFAESGVFGFLPLMIDFSMLSMGAGAALLWSYSPFASILGLMPLYLIYSTLRLPALKRQTETDSKTGIFNAAYFSNSVRTELDRARRFNRPLTIVMADLDLLRNINNTYGHLAGDVVLAGVAAELQGLSREYDVVARFGGEEFGILLPETTPEEAYPLIEAMRNAIAETEFRVSTSVAPIQATMSFGIAGRTGKEKSADALIHSADVALYQAKQNGRNRTVLYSANGVHDGKPAMLAIDSSGESVSHSAAARNERHRDLAEASTAAVEATERKLAGVEEGGRRAPVTVQTPPGWRIAVYISAVAILAVFLSAVVFMAAPDLEIDWLGLALFAAAAILTEATSVEIYLRDTAVSTSAVPLVAGTLLFGPIGAILLGLVTAMATHVKNRFRISRLIFNSSNFVIGNMLGAAIMVIIGTPITALNMPALAGVSISAAIAVYLSTTILLSGAIRSDTGQPAEVVWVERFRWLAPYYLVLGVVAFGLIFSYQFAGQLGVIVILIPLYMLRFSQKQYIDRTKEMVNALRQSNAELIRQASEITLLNEELLLTMARSVDLRDPHVLEHSKQVARYACLVAEELGLSPDRIELIRKAGLLHDIGKLGIPESILFKPGLLSDEEFGVVKVHVLIGADLISGCHSLHVLIPFVKHHHEWYDGSGYPEGLVGDEIPIEARILCLADAVEAMASDRPYKKAMSPNEILQEVLKCAGTQFDPKVADAFERVVMKKGESVIRNSAREVYRRSRRGPLSSDAVLAS